MTFRQLKIDFDWNTNAHAFRVVSANTVQSAPHSAVYASLPVCVDRCEIIHPSVPRIRARWSLERPSAATANFYVEDALVSSCLFVSGLDREADGRAVDDFAFGSGVDLAVDEVLRGQVVSGAPAVASFSWPNPALLDEDTQRVAVMEVCLAATFFEGLFPDRAARPN